MQGVRVVELGTWVAAPATAGMLGDWGADVVKVEATTGDPQRDIFSALGVDTGRAAVPPFEIDNRGKRSIVLDLRSGAGKEAMERLLASADVFVTNMRVPALTRLGLDDRSVRARYPRLIYAIVTASGMRGPEADRPGYDIGSFWARSSLCCSVTPRGQMPPAIRSGTGDHATGISMVAGIAAALFDRERTGRGHLVTTSLLRTGMYLAGWDLGVLLRFGRLERPRPRERIRTPLLNCYATSDDRGFWLLGVESDRHWPSLIAAIGRPDLAADERFAVASARQSNSEALIAELDLVGTHQHTGDDSRRSAGPCLGGVHPDDAASG
jgi:crotonobetainyl-CoA:carnitine CoA-transferase CaiB-like acyl-CoA transferase